MNVEKSPFVGEVISARKGDVPDVLRMVSELARHHGDVASVTPQELERDILGPNPWVRVLLAIQGPLAVGYAALCPLAQMQFGARGMDLQHLFVMHEFRRMGVGKALINASKRVAEAQGCVYLSVGTHPDNTLVHAIYPALGFQIQDASGPRFRIPIASE